MNPDGNQVTTRLTVDDLIVGKQIADGSGNVHRLTEVVGDDSFKAVTERNIELEIQNNEGLYNKATEQGHLDMDSSVDFESLFKDENFLKEVIGVAGDETVYKLYKAQPQTQQYIELTPDVVAKIKGEAPKFKMKNPSAGEALPLLLLALGGGGVVATQQ